VAKSRWNVAAFFALIAAFRPAKQRAVAKQNSTRTAE
jgi:hypothetical protein